MGGAIWAIGPAEVDILVVGGAMGVGALEGGILDTPEVGTSDVGGADDIVGGAKGAAAFECMATLDRGALRAFIPAPGWI